MPIAYATLMGIYALSFFGAKRKLDHLTLPALLTVILLHFVHISVRTAEFDHPPVTTVYEVLTILAVCIAVAYAYIEIRTKTTSTGFFVLFLAFVFQTISSLFIRDLVDIDPVLRSRLLGFHVSAALLGYTAISLSAVYGLLYLMLYHEIKSSRLGLIYSRLPNLETLERMSHKAEIFGFVMLTIAIIVGLFWLPQAFSSVSYWDPKLIATLVIWGIYAGGLWAKWEFGWQGRKTMILSLVGFGFIVLSMTVVNLYWSEFHGFY
jgi:ABC-type transport system involved in cytochrome c biogenesis permease subunit